MRRVRHILFFLLAFSPLAFSQGGFYQDRAEGKIQFSPYANALVALPGATVTVCTDSTCAIQVPLYRNAALSQPLPTNVVTADDNGNFSFFASPGIYWCIFNASGWIPFSRACQVSTTSPLVTNFAQNISFTGNNTHTGVETFGNINGVLSVDGAKYPLTSAGIQSAINALPSSGGLVQLSCNPFSLNTTITISTPNVTLQGCGASMPGATGGTTLTWTGGASAVISNQAAGTVLRAFNLNNTGSATVGISQVGGGGFYKVLLDDISITTPTVQFSVAGVQTTTAGRTAWFTMRHCWIQQAAPIGADIDVTNLFVSDNSTFWGNNTNIRVGHTATVFSFQFVDGSDSELIAANGNTGIGIDLQSVESANIKNSYLEGNGDAAAGQEGQIPINIAGASGFIDIEGNYIQGNSHTNYAIKITGTPTVLSFKNNEFKNLLTGGIDNTGGTATLIDLAQNGIPGTTPTVINGLTGVVFNLSTTGILSINGSQVTRATSSGTATVDLASVASGACTADSADVTMTGAVVGDDVRVTAATALPAGVRLIGRVMASNTGRFQLCNWSGGAVDRASDTYTLSVVK